MTRYGANISQPYEPKSEPSQERTRLKNALRELPPKKRLKNALKELGRLKCA